MAAVLKNDESAELSCGIDCLKRKTYVDILSSMEGKGRVLRGRAKVVFENKEREEGVERKRDKGKQAFRCFLIGPQTMEKEVDQSSMQMETAKVMVKSRKYEFTRLPLVPHVDSNNDMLFSVFSSANHQRTTDRDEGQMRPYPMEVASVTRAANDNGSTEELRGEGDEQVVKERGNENPEGKEKGKEQAEAVYPGEKGA
ncbi:hypothetical protein K435DRAFT_840339 [Dendrothele bispora CBS 962.96]|uniref:Uncharacterized protein n=1 Tax=Dendrothele bispora (strain CBS 962.96) TaxID=1314807 RepID=A0A4S8LUN1_DENBC|nr:hypothetical protein K435DRAFT_840339 [Dendrothele bispora CBS 962.96]